jgi:hypothetical protein
MASGKPFIEPFSRAGPTPKDLEQTADLEKVQLASQEDSTPASIALLSAKRPAQQASSAPSSSGSQAQRAH